jgi:hypothetical protein
MPNDRVLDVIRISEIILETMLMHALTEQTNVWHRSLKPNFAKRSFLEDDYQSGARDLHRSPMLEACPRWIR